MEVRVTAAVVVAVVLAAVIATAIFSRLSDTRADDAKRVEAVADALSKSLASGAQPQPILSAIVESGAAAGAVLYDASGAPVARAGGLKPAAPLEVVCRSVGGGTVCVEPARRTHSIARAAIAAGLAGVIVAVIAALSITWIVGRQLRTVRVAVDRAAEDPSFAQRIEPARGELAPLAASLNRLLDDMQSRESELRRRSHDLESANRDLESFAHSVSHDLRGPLGSVIGFSEALREGYGGDLTAEGREYVQWILQSSHQMHSLIDGLLSLSRVSRAEMQRGSVDLSAIAKGIASSLQKSTPERSVDFAIEDNVIANGDEHLLRAVMENLIANAWKFTGRRDRARIEFGMTRGNGHSTYFVRDNGAGFDPALASKMFRPFQRLHSATEFDGTGIGLATVQRILQRHGGKAWADGEPDRGATIWFTTQ